MNEFEQRTLNFFAYLDDALDSAVDEIANGNYEVLHANNYLTTLKVKNTYVELWIANGKGAFCIYKIFGFEVRHICEKKDNSKLKSAYESIMAEVSDFIKNTEIKDLEQKLEKMKQQIKG